MGLFRAAEKEKMWEFLSHDFRDQQWKSAALKNAFGLVSRRQFGMCQNVLFAMCVDGARSELYLKGELDGEKHNISC